MPNDLRTLSGWDLITWNKLFRPTVSTLCGKCSSHTMSPPPASGTWLTRLRVPKLWLILGHGVYRSSDLDLWSFDLGIGVHCHPWYRQYSCHFLVLLRLVVVELWANRSQWSSGSTPVRDEVLRLNRAVGSCVYRKKKHCDLQPWARAVRTFPAVPRSITQPFTLHGTVNEYQLSGWVIIINGDGDCRR